MKFVLHIKDKIKAIHHSLPAKIRRLYFPLTWCYIKLRVIFHTLFPKVIITKGNSTDSVHPLSIIFINVELPEFTYWSQKALGQNIQKTDLGRMWFRTACKIVKASPYNLAIVQDEFLVKKLFHIKNFFNIPYMMEMEIDISKPIKELPRKERESFISAARRIRKHNLSLEISHDINLFSYFYYNMYLPLLQNRYAEQSILEDYNVLKKVLLKGELLFVKKDNELITGTLIEYKGKQVILRVAGVKNGDFTYIKYGAVNVLYYYAASVMHEKGYKKLNISGTRPNLADGLTKYKMALRAKIRHPFITIDEKKFLQFIPLKDSERLKIFFIDNPFVYYPKPRTPYRALFVDAQKPIAKEEFRKILKDTNCCGICGTNIFIMNNNEIIPDWVSTELNNTSGNIINFPI